MMKIRWIACLVALGAVACGSEMGDIGSTQQSISSGTYDTNTYPNVGAMMVEIVGVGSVPFCSGTLIGERAFLTAGHCTFAYDYYAAMGLVTGIGVTFDADAVNAPTLLPVASIHTHPEYGGPNSNFQDVGVIVLENAVTNITPATLPSAGLLNDLKKQKKLVGSTFTKVGYGATVTFPPPSDYYEDQRQYVESKYVGLLKAQLLLQQNLAAGNAGTCYGDSGGPAFWKNDDGSLVVVGITSWGDPHCIAVGFDYRVDVPQTLDFIAAVTQGL